MKRTTTLLMALTLVFLLVLPAHAQTDSDVRYFPETGHSLAHGFKAFWDQNGALPVFGYPLADELAQTSSDDGKTYTVQYLERQRFEYHPENAGTPYAVLLGRLGVDVLSSQGRDWFTFPKASPTAPHYFGETGHAIAPQFWDYWSTHGLEFGDRGVSFRESLALFGQPISEPQMESFSTGDEVLTQWYERARFEYHPDNPAAFKVLLGRLGAETLALQTPQTALLKPAVGGQAIPIISTGNTLPNGYRFPSIPDGIGIIANGNGTADVFVAHETSTVPFPAVGSAGAAADFGNAEISKLRISQSTVKALVGQSAWSSAKNFARFCSATLAGTDEGFQQPVFFTGEETNDILSEPPNPAWPATGTTRQAGYVVAVEARTGKQYVIPGMGRMNHENTVIVPGGWKDKIVAVTDDDTFSAPGAQLYMYLANTPQNLLDDKGQLYAFVSDDPAINDYGDVTAETSVGGRFIAVPRDIALGDQNALEDWSNNNNVFQFIRTEDIAYDKNNPRVLYIADTGEPRATVNPKSGRLQRDSSTTKGPYPNGRVFRMSLNASDPLQVNSLELLIDADAAGYNTNGLHNPDNLGTSGNSLMIQEDPISVNNFNPGEGPTARIWRFDLESGKLTVVAEVDQSQDPKAKTGNWESSGIVDASAAFGPGSWLVSVQAHSLWVETAPADGYTRKLEGGQLLLLKVPGS